MDKYIIVKTEKSKGIAFLLVLFLGPIGLLYSTINGAVKMILIFIVGGILAFAMFGVVAALIGPIIWILCFMEASSSVDKYNNDLHNLVEDKNTSTPDQKNNNSYNNVKDSEPVTKYNPGKIPKWRNLFYNMILAFIVLAIISVIIYDSYNK
jgi:hypothetical protein